MAAMVGGFSESKDIVFGVVVENEELKESSKAISIISCEPAQLSPPAKHPKEDDLIVKPELNLGPQLSLKEQIEKDQDDESLKKWKEKLLGSVDISATAGAGESKEAEVKVEKLSILSPGRADQVLAIPFVPNSKGTLFTLKEGSRTRFKFCFTVSNNIVSGFTYTNTVWKSGIRVDNRRVMLGTYSPKQEPYSYAFEEETIPTGMFARGSYSARTKFVDDDGKCYLDARYRFEIQKKW